jgi:hypothetical protein
MTNVKWHTITLALTLLVTASLIAGCITIVDKPAAPKAPSTTPAPAAKPSPPAQQPPPAAGSPVVKSFTAEPASISPGQQSTLTWVVTGATTVNVTPKVGSIAADNTVMVSPLNTTTYTLTATNNAGTVSSSVIVNVKASGADLPDLVITDFWFQGSDIYYKAKNIGRAAAKGNRAFFYFNNMKVAQDYTEALEPGQERTSIFGNYNWTWKPPTEVPYVTGVDQISLFQAVVKVCADAENVIAESNEGNNCLTKIWGMKYTYDLQARAHQAQWQTSSGDLTLPVPQGSKTGEVVVTSVAMEDGSSLGTALATFPPSGSGGWLQGRYSEFYNDRDTRYLGMNKEIILPAACKFSATVGFTKDAPTDAKAKFILGYVEANSGTSAYFPAVTATLDGKLNQYEVDLSDLEGKKIFLLLRVEGQGSSDNPAVWIDAKVTQ